MHETTSWYRSRDTHKIQYGRQYGHLYGHRATKYRSMGWEVERNDILALNPTFSTIPDSLVIPLTLPDVSRQPEIKMATCKPEVRYITGLDRDILEISVAKTTFSTTPD